MNPKIAENMKTWSEKSGRPIAELEKAFAGYVDEYKKALPGKEDATYEDFAQRKLFLEVKADMVSPAKPYDVIVLGMSGVLDVTATDAAEKKALYDNPETRGQAIAELKVSSVDGEYKDDEGKPLPAGTPLDTNPWMIAPDPKATDDRRKKGVKNPNFKKPIRPLPTRNIVAFGRPASGGHFKIINIVARNEQAALQPKITGTFRVRLNLQNESDYFYGCSAGRRTTFEPVIIPEYEPVTIEKIVGIFNSAPAVVAPALAGLMEWFGIHEKDRPLLVLYSGDVTRMMDPLPNGNQLVIIEDSSALDLESEGTTMWVPKELQPLDFGPGSKVSGIARPNKGAGYNRETRTTDPTVERINLNCLSIFADPVFRVAPEEANVVAPEEAS